MCLCGKIGLWRYFIVEKKPTDKSGIYCCCEVLRQGAKSLRSARGEIEI
jgi:hypothetical protein